MDRIHLGTATSRVVALMQEEWAQSGHKAMLPDLERTGGDQISLIDPDSPAMARMTKVGVDYNLQSAVEARHRLIMKQKVCSQVLTCSFSRRPWKPPW